MVVEKFAPVSPQQTITWSTSTEYPGKFGIHDPRVVEILQVTTTEGRPLTYDVRRPLGRMVVKIDAVGAREIRLVYSVRNGVRFLHDRDELQWRVGEGWRGDTQKASLFVQVPPELAGMVRTQAYVSGHGLLPVKATEAGPDRVWFETDAVGQGEELLVDVVLPKGEIKEPVIGKRFEWFLSANTIVLLPLATLAVMVLLRSLKRLPPRPDFTVAPRYEPPAGLTPAEVGLLVDDQLDPRDVTATFIDLAIRGFIRLVPCEPDEGVQFDGHDFKLELLRRPKDEWHALALHERTLLFHSFYGGSWTKLSSLTIRFYSIVPLIRRHVAQLLRTKGMYWTDPDYAQSARMTLMLMFFAAALVIQLVGLFSFASSWLLSLVALGASAAIVHYFGRGITSKTMRGLRAYEQVLGFQEFLDSVERDRLERLPAELFEKWLPYAMALGVEHHWAKNFEGIAIPKLEWMEGLEDAVFGSEGLVRALAVIARETAAGATAGR